MTPLCNIFQTIGQSLGGYLTPVVAIIAVLIAFKQYQLANKQRLLNERKLKMDLFEKRFKVFNEINNLISDLIISGIKETHEINILDQKINERIFIFKSELNVYIDEIIKKSRRLSQTEYILKSNTLTVENRKNLSIENDNLYNWITHEYQNLTQHFEEYLNFRNL
jgi:hypothetical protein